jgi:hypothetical protein
MSEVEKVELRIVQKAQESHALTCGEWVLVFVVGGCIVWLMR